MRKKYTTAFKLMIVDEFLGGATAKELFAKYGVKQRTVYHWVSSARKDSISNDTRNTKLQEFIRGEDVKSTKIKNMEDQIRYLIKEVKEIKEKIN